MPQDYANPRAPRPIARPAFDSAFCEERNRPRILAAAILGSAMGFIDGSVVAIAIPAIREDLGASLSQAQWINNAYMVTLSALVLAGGAVGDRFGTAKMFATGIAVFVVTSLLCAVAPTPDALIYARFAQGAGAALMVPGSLAIIARAYPREIRGAAIGTWAAASAMTTALGPVIGGLALSFGPPTIWRWIFAMNLPLGMIALWLVLRTVRTDKARPERRLDLPGALLATLALGLLAAGLTRAEGGDGALPLTLAGCAALVAFLVFEARAASPMMPLTLFRNPGFKAANLATFALYFGLSAVLFFLPMLLITGWGLTEIIATFAFAPLSACIFLFSARFGRLADRIGPGPLIGGGAALVAAGYVWLGFAAQTESFWLGILPPMLVSGFGMSMVVAPLSAAIMTGVEDGDSGAASGINNAVSRVAGLVAVAAMGGVAAVAYRAAGGGLGYGETGADPVHVAAMGHAFGTIAWISAGLAAISSLFALLGIRGRPAQQGGGRQSRSGPRPSPETETPKT